MLRRGEEGFFRIFLSFGRDINPEEVILETDPDANGWSLRALEGVEAPPADWSFVEVTSSRELFDEKVPKPSEYAVLLAKLHKAGARELASTQGFSWPNAVELELRALDGSLRPFENILLPIEITEVPQPSSSPVWLQQSLLAPETLQGDASGLPLMNQVAVPSSVSARSDLRFAFPDFGSRDLQYRAPGRLPLVTRWEGHYLPSWPLSLAMLMEGVALDEVIIEPGRHLRIGSEGPVIPLDGFGRAKLEKAQAAPKELDLLAAKFLFPLDESEFPKLANGVVLLDATDQNAARQSHQLITAAHTLRGFPRPGKIEKFRRLSLVWEIFIHLEIVLVGLIALYLRPFFQLIAWAVLIAGLIFFALGLLNWHGLWMPILPLLMAIVVAWCLIGYLQQVAHPARAKKKV